MRAGNEPGSAVLQTSRKRIAFYGGSFDPIHKGHLAIGEAVLTKFGLDQFVFIPAFHAPHKKRNAPTSAYDRHAMLCLATAEMHDLRVSKIEIEMPERPFSVETLSRLNAEFPHDEIFFVMGADSWLEITTWREWETVLSLTNHIIVTRPGYEIQTSHVTAEIKAKILDVRSSVPTLPSAADGRHIYFTDIVNMDVSATAIRRDIRGGGSAWRHDVPAPVANYIEKYQIYS